MASTTEKPVRKATDSPRVIYSQLSSRNNIFKSSSRKPYLRATTTAKPDQSVEPSNQLAKGVDETTKLGELATVLSEMQKVSVRPRSVTKNLKQVVSTEPSLYSTPIIVLHQEPNQLVKAVRTYTPKVTPKTYDYYDDAIRIVSELPINSKVVLHGSGDIQCLDQGNFPHPASCKKFISCAKIDNGDILAWEYRCPKYLSFDPIGGMCNWATGVGCNE